ncbi:response regulator [Lyngbya aestuarii]|uniref:response regulator n=1 Tax=Lyngbya aestuarii TaxID=118322 RepID=UPI00403E064F
MGTEQQQRILGYFVEEAKDHLNTIEQGLLNLQSTMEDIEMVNEIFRAAHSVKGGAAMLGIDCIQQVAHRLEDCFKALKESPVKADYQLESLFLQVFDILQSLVEQLQRPFGLTEEIARDIMADAEQVFEELNTHLTQLIKKATTSQVAPNKVIQAVDEPPSLVRNQVSQKTSIPSGKNTKVPSLTFKREVLLQLREMIRLFKQQDNQTSRQALQKHCRVLANLGEGRDLSGWSELIEVSRVAITRPQNSYNQLANLVIKEIKQAQELVTAGCSAEIAPSDKMKALTPDFRASRFVTASDANLSPKSIAPDAISNTNNAAKGSVFSVNNSANKPDTYIQEDNTQIQESVAQELSEQNFTQDHTARWSNGGNNRVTDPTKPSTSSTPEVGMAELNSLADIFEGQTPDLEETWQEEEIISLEDTSWAQELGESLSSDDQRDFDELMDELDNWESSGKDTSNEDLTNWLGDESLEEFTLDFQDSTESPPNQSQPSLESGTTEDLADLLFKDENLDQLASQPLDTNDLSSLFDTESFFTENTSGADKRAELQPQELASQDPLAIQRSFGDLSSLFEDNEEPEQNAPEDWQQWEFSLDDQQATGTLNNSSLDLEPRVIECPSHEEKIENSDFDDLFDHEPISSVELSQDSELGSLDVEDLFAQSTENDLEGFEQPSLLLDKLELDSSPEQETSSEFEPLNDLLDDLDRQQSNSVVVDSQPEAEELSSLWTSLEEDSSDTTSEENRSAAAMAFEWELESDDEAITDALTPEKKLGATEAENLEELLATQTDELNDIESDELTEEQFARWNFEPEIKPQATPGNLVEATDLNDIWAAEIAADLSLETEEDYQAQSAAVTNTASESELPLDEFEELEAMLASARSEASATSSANDIFDELEMILGEPPPASAKPSSAPAQIQAEEEDTTEDEFEKLQEMLEEATKLAGPPQPRGEKRPIRPMVRPRSNPVIEQTMRVPVKHLDSLSNLVGELVVSRNSLEQDQERLRQFLDNLSHQVSALGDVGTRMRDLYERSLLESSLLASRQSYRSAFTTERPSINNESSDAEYHPLEMDRFTGFHLLSQEMIELIVQVRESASDIEFLVDETDQVARILRQVTTQLQEGLTRSRMVPFAHTADRLPRAVREISLRLGKEAQMHVEGREALIDKMILEHLFDPMTHLVNNALTHGIESPEVRRASGKAPAGHITLRAFVQGNQTILSIADDGAGIDPERVRTKAIEKKLIAPTEARSLTKSDLYDLLFHPGFTTIDQAGEFAGRGVGLDVVRTKLSEIRGAVHVDSQVGKGTTFTIRLPLTLSICKALCCLSNRARIAFPMDGVEDVLDVSPDSIKINSENKTCIQWRETLLPFQPLADLLKYNRQLSRATVYGKREDDLISIVVLRSAGRYIALQVDQALGEQEIVIKQLEGPAPKPAGIAGATVLGDGRIMPIADVMELIDIAEGTPRGVTIWQQDEPSTPIAENVPETKPDPIVLIVDDSITVRSLLEMTFTKSGYRVEQARDGQEAWEKLRSGLPCDLVFCDIEMPRMNGIELLARLQKDDDLRHIPIAMLTSRGAQRHQQEASRLGARGYFIKPYQDEVLLDAAQRMVKGEVLFGNSSKS